MRAQACGGCGTVRVPPAPVCPRCLGETWEWRELSGRGTVEAFGWYLRSVAGAVPAGQWATPGVLPYSIAVVRLDEGPGVFANIEGVAFGELRVGQPVEAVDRDAAPGTVNFRPAGHP